jgi:acyl carrier protein
MKQIERATADPDIEGRIRKFIATQVLFTDGDFPYSDDTSFLSEGIIDSLGVMELMAFVKTRFGVAVDQSEVTPTHFDSVAKLAAFVRKKIAEGAAQPGKQTS